MGWPRMLPDYLQACPCASHVPRCGSCRSFWLGFLLRSRTLSAGGCTCENSSAGGDPCRIVFMQQCIHAAAIHAAVYPCSSVPMRSSAGGDPQCAGGDD
eukprot:229053-Pelagomonas_calceolata.AAC.1